MPAILIHPYVRPSSAITGQRDSEDISISRAMGREVPVRKSVGGLILNLDDVTHPEDHTKGFSLAR